MTDTSRLVFNQALNLIDDYKKLLSNSYVRNEDYCDLVKAPLNRASADRQVLYI